MRLNSNFILRNIAENWVVVPVGAASLDFQGIIHLNPTALELWKALEKGATQTDLVGLLISSYGVTPEEAQQDVEAFLNKLRQVGCLTE